MSRPTTWITDLKHYIDEDTDDWVEVMPVVPTATALDHPPRLPVAHPT